MGFQHNKSFGQHFLKQPETAGRIVEALSPLPEQIPILEIGPGLGILTKFLLQTEHPIYCSEIDHRIIAFLKEKLLMPSDHILEGDFLRLDIRKYFQQPLAVIGNFPYNISSQILFAVLDVMELVPVVVGMFQREMAQRVTADHGNKDYGIISVLIQTWYDTEYLFELPPDAFDPPPKVHSAVIKLRRKQVAPDVDPKALKNVVKTAFNQRRKKLSNALSGIPNAVPVLHQLNFAGKRAEELSVSEFLTLTKAIQAAK
ncbi:MAG TPA: 16S rRNA (adenine(1518)-N(6)/adenine(1519)-N(6))-dimethyltransferase RsmA [Chitinophagales bacterium]|nr:16S rRNA (adenine(1518)-N(6)/adenine(1519)-N(6))-dimethyltransferase RsmA [Chitinophagales bacterium]HNA57931.1 16S rRNA (adenine(1518)-N(6)/adenine(1519)-N(6))-dimethyltransferase RsmA [Chitinophagales bacterium]HNE44866.1 16S rRNA (adenine(1518)-N(6)/adenine(1519)-N(6))-dimethyltransferase RsmA [Chitinophagales bacterium]HNI53008.1 16S rRNA (adenine(1518)-N(6)/adenine(1519)-N(6))-dimethyltransferase RsmA [Chitinophagales bacterium]HNO27186.1 16S rRNA (adenine(1518)-N(6)/adenine(1519)-N(6))